ncbi:MAG: 2-dehydro-3-deoxyglucarate aldolase [Chloroflexi bacterium]|nr:2-dehydro-3-deoxyglucarate aldolase [Chloroflexota bacterium]
MSAIVRPNTMKAKLKAGQPVFGVQIDTPWPELVEVCGHLGFDWAFLDAEHGPLAEADIAHMVRAAESAGITPVVRVPRNEPETILRYMETGVAGIVVPQVNSGEEARRVVAAVKYPPQGRRGIGSSRASGYGFGPPGDVYRSQVNDQTVVILLLENIRGVENLDEILAVDGVDVVFVGPADLSASMGGPIGLEEPSVQGVVDDVLERTIAAGRIAGVNTGPRGSRAREYADAGVLCLITGAWGLIGAGASAYLSAARRS